MNDRLIFVSSEHEPYRSINRNKGVFFYFIVGIYYLFDRHTSSCRFEVQALIYLYLVILRKDFKRPVDIDDRIYPRATVCLADDLEHLLAIRVHVFVFLAHLLLEVLNVAPLHLHV